MIIYVFLCDIYRGEYMIWVALKTFGDAQVY